MSLNFVVVCFNIGERLTAERQAQGPERGVRQEPCSPFPGELPGGGAAGSAVLPAKWLHAENGSHTSCWRRCLHNFAHSCFLQLVAPGPLSGDGGKSLELAAGETKPGCISLTAPAATGQELLCC